MRDLRDFPKSLVIALGFVLFCYTFLSVLCYWHMGAATPAYLMDVLQWDNVRVITNLLMVIHMVISYTLNQQILCRAFHLQYDPVHATAVNKRFSGYLWSRFQWLCITTMAMFVAFMISNIISFFDVLIELIGSLCSATLGFLFPAVFYLRCGVIYNWNIRRIERALMYFIIIFSLMLTIFGTISSLRQVIEESKMYGEPFECHCESKACSIS